MAERLDGLDEALGAYDVPLRPVSEILQQGRAAARRRTRQRAATVLTSASMVTVAALVAAPHINGGSGEQPVAAQPPAIATQTPPGSGTAGAGGTTPTLARVPLSVSRGVIAGNVWLYFGSAAVLRTTLADSAAPDLVAPETSGACALTVVVTGLAADQSGALIAQGLGQGWRALENAPSLRPANRTLHMQTITPPARVSPTATWDFSVRLNLDGSAPLSTEATTMTLLNSTSTGTSSIQRWSLSTGQTVECDRYV